MSMHIRVEVDEKTVERLVANYIQSITGTHPALDKVNIQVKSAQNWKAEWEQAKLRCVYEERVVE